MNPSLVGRATKPRRLKVEFYDNDGVRHTLSIDGPITREKVGKVLDIVEVMSGTPSHTALELSPRKFDRLASTLISRLKERPFTSAEAKAAFETMFREKIPLSTVSTYLSRLVDRGVLERAEGSASSVLYRVRSGELSGSLAVQSSTLTS